MNTHMFWFTWVPENKMLYSQSIQYNPTHIQHSLDQDSDILG